MKIIKRGSNSIQKETAHAGSGSRKVYADSEYVNSKNLEAITHGWLPAKGTFDWHLHENIEEVMVVLSGTGEVHDRDGVYTYSPGDVFIFPTNIEHKIHNPTNTEHEMLFVRVRAFED